MESSHNLVLLLALSTLFSFFPISYAYTKCVCHEVMDDGTIREFTNISYGSNHTVSANPHVASNQSSNQNQQASTYQKAHVASQNTSKGSAVNNHRGATQNNHHETTQNNSQGSTSQSRQSTSHNTNNQSQGTTQNNSTLNNSHGSTQSYTNRNNTSDGTMSSNSRGAAQSNSQGTTQNNQEGTTSNINLKGVFSKVFAFGDSYTDKGNAPLLGGKVPSAGSDSTFHSSTGPQSVQTQTCDGSLIIDYLCDALGLPPLPSYKNSSVKTFTYGINFAIAGSSALPRDYFDHFAKVASSFLNVTPVSFQTQIDWFHNFLNQLGCKQKDNCKAELEKALFWLGGMGIDDHARTLGTSYSLEWLKDKSVAHISTMLQELLKNGAKYIVVQGLPPLGCLTMELALFPLKKHLNPLGCAMAVNAATMVHNQILKKMLETFRAQYPNAHILYGDLWGAFLTILENPGKFNFQETFKACCGAGGNLNFNIQALCGSHGTTRCTEPSKYIIWDGIHLTTAMNKQLAHLLLNQGFCQPSFSEMVMKVTGP